MCDIRQSTINVQWSVIKRILWIVQAFRNLNSEVVISRSNVGNKVKVEIQNKDKYSDNFFENFPCFLGGPQFTIAFSLAL